MKVRLTPKSEQELEVISRVGAEQKGFLLGLKIGSFLVIESFFPLTFGPGDIDDIYHSAFLRFGGKLKGLFFKNSEVIFTDWSAGDVVCQISGNRHEFFFCDINRELIPLKD